MNDSRDFYVLEANSFELVYDVSRVVGLLVKRLCEPIDCVSNKRF